MRDNMPYIAVPIAETRTSVSFPRSFVIEAIREKCERDNIEIPDNAVFDYFKEYHELYLFENPPDQSVVTASWNNQFDTKKRADDGPI